MQEKVSTGLWNLLGFGRRGHSRSNQEAEVRATLFQWHSPESLLVLSENGGKEFLRKASLNHEVREGKGVHRDLCKAAGEDECVWACREIQGFLGQGI